MTTQEELSTTIRDLVQPGKGILAADESHPTIAKRFKAVGVESSEDMRREYRSLIFFGFRARGIHQWGHPV